MKLAIFDLDNTLLAGDSDYLWGRYLVDNGLVDAERYERENQRFYDEYRQGTLDIREFARFSLEPLVRLQGASMLALRERFVSERIAPIVARDARALLQRHRDEGAHLLITTATNRFITEPVAELLGVDTLIATDPETHEGRYTGELAGVPNFQAGKVERLQQWLAAQNWHPSRTWAYSDSRNDLPLLEFADHPVAVDPDPVLRQTALERGWSVISLRGEC